MTASYITVELASGRVVNVTVGQAPTPIGYESIPRSDAAADAVIGSTRQEDGSYLPPPSPPESDEEVL